MLRVAKIGVAVTGREGSAIDILMAGEVYVTDINDGLELLIYPKRLKATLRY